MYFSLRSPGPEQQDTVCYFRMHSAEREPVYSPFFPNREAALAGMEKLVLGLRNGSYGSKSSRRNGTRGYTVPLFERSRPADGSGIFFPDKEAAYATLLDWQAAARASTYKLIFWELEATEERYPSLETLDLSEGDERHPWREAGSSLFNIDQKHKRRFKPSVGLQANLARGRCEPVFNAMQPFVSADLPLFHGRKREVEEIYTLLQRRPLLLLYGAPRVGKTSLLQCGLANRLDEASEHLVVIRREEEDLLATLNGALRRELGEEENSSLLDPMALARRLADRTQKRIYLVFDQLERFFTTDVFDTERNTFFDVLSAWTRDKETPFRIVLALREEFLAPVAEYEEQLPALLDNRYRLLPLKESSMVDATLNLLDVLSLRENVMVDEPRVFAEKACGALVNEKGEVPMHCLQMYLHQLHQTSCAETTEGPVPLNPALIDRAGTAPQLIDRFISDRLTALEDRRASGDQLSAAVLDREIEELEASRISCGCGEKKPVAAAAAVVPAPVVFPWASLLAVAAIPFGLFFLYWWFTAAADPLTACELTEEAGTCEAYVSYLCTYGDSAECAPRFLETLAANDCAVYRDYRLLREVATCGVYQEFFTKYRDRGICLDRVREKLLAWQCPIVRDTLKITRVDTIVRTVPVATPTTYQSAPLTAGNAGCEEIGVYNFKKVGALWLMTEALPGGPFSWEDALDACAARGFRLPCIGEIDFLIDKIYRNDPVNAYNNLTGSDPCSLVNPVDIPGGKIEFWTATEADDGTAWSFMFDVAERSIRTQSSAPKSARLPCLCVQRDPDRQGSGLPPCYQKQIDRRTAQ